MAMSKSSCASSVNVMPATDSAASGIVSDEGRTSIGPPASVLANANRASPVPVTRAS